eukprot:1471642-Rhodomonas_salina.1
MGLPTWTATAVPYFYLGGNKIWFFLACSTCASDQYEAWLSALNHKVQLPLLGLLSADSTGSSRDASRQLSFSSPRPVTVAGVQAPSLLTPTPQLRLSTSRVTSAPVARATTHPVVDT